MITQDELKQIIDNITKESMTSTFGLIIPKDILVEILEKYTENEN